MDNISNSSYDVDICYDARDSIELSLIDWNKMDSERDVIIK